MAILSGKMQYFNGIAVWFVSSQLSGNMQVRKLNGFSQKQAMLTPCAFRVTIKLGSCVPTEATDRSHCTVHHCSLPLKMATADDITSRDIACDIIHIRSVCNMLLTAG